MKKILTIVGARPQFVKAAVLSRNILSRIGVEEILVHTGQHFDDNMSEVFFREMGIPKPTVQLNINGMSHGKMTGEMMMALEEILLNEKPDIVVVYGDTNSTLAGALVASKLHIPIAHIEAGLRSFNMEMPEEINRIITDRISKWLFCPTETAVNNLKVEGYENFDDVHLYQVGDIMLDAVNFYLKSLKDKASYLPDLPDEYILCTVHRQENVNKLERIKNIISAINDVHQNIYPIVLPLHPGTAQRLKKMDIKFNCITIDPVGYFDMLRLIKNSQLVMTDSGGIQKEAYFMNKGCVTLRDQTEWTELVGHKVNILAGADPQEILSSVKYFANHDIDNSKKLYGDGDAGRRILDILMQ